MPCASSSSDGWSASSSFLDGGVRFKRIDFDTAHWDFIELPDSIAARKWFAQHEGAGYDILGIARFVVGFIPNSNRRWFCSEAVAEALGIHDSWRYDPNLLYSALRKNQ